MSRDRKIWVNTRKRRSMLDQSMNKYMEMPAVNVEQQGLDMYVDGALYVKAIQIIINNAKVCKDKEVAKNLVQGLVDLSEYDANS